MREVMHNTYATKTDFENARLGTPFLNVCSSCGEEDGTIAIKSRGNGKNPSSPRYLPSELCEACQALTTLVTEKVIEGDFTDCEIAKLIDENDELIAWVPFNRSLENPTITVGGIITTLKHKMIIKCEMSEEGAHLISITEKGIPLSQIKEIRHTTNTFES